MMKKPASIALSIAVSAATHLATAQHEHGGHAAADWIPREVLERPVPLRSGIGTIHEAVTTGVPEAQAFYDQGLAYLHSYVWVEAARSFHQALRLDPSVVMAYVGLSRALSGLEDFEGARRALEGASPHLSRASEREGLRVDLRRQQLDAIAEGEGAGKHLQYRKALDDALAADPDNAELWLLRGNAEEQSAAGIGQRGGAATIAFYEAALARYPDHLGAHHYLTHTYETIGHADRALPRGEAHARLAPKVAHAQHMYGHDLRRVGRTAEAIAQFEKARKLENDYYASEGIPPEYDWHHVHNLNLLAMCYQYLGRMADAEELLKEAFALPKSSEYFEAWSRDWPQFLLSRGRFEEALEAARGMTNGKWPNARAFGHIAAASALVGQKRLQEAAAELLAAEREAAEITGRGTMIARPEATRPFLSAGQGELMLASGRRAEGALRLQSIQQTLRRLPGADPWIEALFRLERIAALARDAGEWELAEYTARQMLEHDSAYGGSHYALALTADHAGDAANARSEYELAASLWKEADADLPELAFLRRRLSELARAPGSRSP
jgi:tetratricopeptide (TPR) repeat protein